MGGSTLHPFTLHPSIESHVLSWFVTNIIHLNGWDLLFCFMPWSVRNADRLFFSFPLLPRPTPLPVFQHPLLSSFLACLLASFLPFPLASFSFLSLLPAPPPIARYKNSSGGIVVTTQSVHRLLFVVCHRWLCVCRSGWWKRWEERGKMNMRLVRGEKNSVLLFSVGLESSSSWERAKPLGVVGWCMDQEARDGCESGDEFLADAGNCWRSRGWWVIFIYSCWGFVVESGERVVLYWVVLL